MYCDSDNEDNYISMNKKQGRGATKATPATVIAIFYCNH